MVLDQTILNILVYRIKNNGVNPLTKTVMVVDDIKIKEYKDEVIKILGL